MSEFTHPSAEYPLPEPQEPGESLADPRYENVVAISEQLDELRPDIHRSYGDPLAVERMQPYEDALPPIDDEARRRLGVLDMPATFDVERQGKLRKEGQFEADLNGPDKVVTDQNGLPWMLKHTKTVPSEMQATEKLASLAFLQDAQPEVFASRAAQAIGYPVRVAHLVQWEGRSWMAGEYVDDAREYTFGYGDKYLTYKGELANQTAFESRPIMNALINSDSDDSNQGIVDPNTATYYPIDFRLGAREVAKPQTDEALQEKILSQFNDDGFGELTEGTDYTAIREGLAKALEEGSLRHVAADRIGDPGMRTAIADGLEQRARVLVSLIDSGALAELQGKAF